MFNSIGNNFGAGQITFKDYQAENYVVLNSKFTFDPTNADYQACDQLEIYVPDLTIDRSAVGGVFIRFVEDYHYSWGDSVYDGGTVLKSWIKDKNTIVIEKQPWFDENGPLIIYILTLYPQLNQGSDTIKSTMQRLTMTTEGNYLRFGYETFMVEFEHWVFIHLMFSGVSYAYRDALWEVTMGSCLQTSRLMFRSAEAATRCTPTATVWQKPTSRTRCSEPAPRDGILRHRSRSLRICLPRQRQQ